MSIYLLDTTLAARPADENHPYGHGRFEILTGLAIGALLTISGVGISYGSYFQIGAAMEPPSAYAIAPLVISLLAKGFLSMYKLRLARRIGSAALAADGKNDFVDLISGCTALAALALTLLDPNRFRHADPIGGILIGCIVCFIGLQVIREASEQLVDTMPGAQQLAALRETAMRVNGVRGIEKVHARKTGLRWHVDVHVEVDPELSVRESHIIGGTVRSTLRRELDWIENVLVHVEPFDKPHSGPMPQ
jgi:cation diffusion facilitator family transporter